jgi:hypothetical protein
MVNLFLQAFVGPDGPDNVVRSSLVLGPANSFIAITPYRVQTNVPSVAPLLGASSGSPVARAALGCGGAWCLQYADGSCRWGFAGGFAPLNTLLLQEVDPRSIKVSLHLCFQFAPL